VATKRRMRIPMRIDRDDVRVNVDDRDVHSRYSLRRCGAPCGRWTVWIGPPSPGGEGGAVSLPLRRAGEEPLPCAGQHDGLGIGIVAAVACAPRLDRHHVADLHRVAFPTRPYQ